ncbi:FHA domain-containing protein [Fusibacter sp. 3D3]|uniref:FHA domain-containing protein n=1 Tax=Fusibacter sp. 3D3 TaxID=1048380 RepID=UPI000852CFE4|nr:FHA domain-containing protein [Fusibacter sp. 3D3]GAU79663.1 FHA-domain-containing proteins [Fusibacter sp. 3D3]
MYAIIAMITKYVLIFVIYMFILKIAKLIYQDIKNMTIWEDSKFMNPHLKLLSSIEKADMNAVTEIFPLKNKITVIGRSLDCEIVISDPHISSRHIQIDKVNQGFKVTDLGSSNMTYINDIKIQEPVMLKEGDKILLGSTELVYSEGGKLNE